MYHGLQQFLVAQHYSGALSGIGPAVFAEPAAYISCLNAVCSGVDIDNVLVLRHIVVYVCISVVKLVRIILEISGYVMSGFIDGVSLARRHVILVEIPVETCPVLFLQAVEYLAFYGLDHIKSDEQIGVILILYGVVGCHFTVQHALVCNVLLPQSFPVIIVDVADIAPQLHEPLLQYCVLVFGEVAEKLLQYSLLFGCKI